jgi:ferredoxin
MKLKKFLIIFENPSKFKKFAVLKEYMIRITHHRAKCIGCNYCAEVAPTRWVMDKNDGKSNLLSAKEKKGIYIAITSNDEYVANMEAMIICPVNIIKVEQI